MIDANATLESLELMKCLSDEEVLSQTKRLMQLNRKLTADALVHVGEMEARGLPPEFDYWSWADDDPSTLLRAARVVREYPPVLDVFQQGDLALASVAALADVITRDNQSEVVARLRRDSGPKPGAARRVPRSESRPSRYRLAFTVDRSLYDKLRVASDLLSEDDDEVTLEEVLVLALETLFDSGLKPK